MIIDCDGAEEEETKAQLKTEKRNCNEESVRKCVRMLAGGAVVSVVDELGLPVKFVGVGEGIEDLQAFDAPSFAGALFDKASKAAAA